MEEEIKANLIREQRDKINQQELEINNYQQLLRTTEQNLKNAKRLLLARVSNLSDKLWWIY